MSKMPTILRVVGWIAFGLLMVIVVASLIGVSFVNENNGGQFALVSMAAIVPICGLIFIVFACFLGASIMSRRLKKLAVSRGKKMWAKIVKTTFLGNERSGKSGSGWDVIRFDLEVEYEGETVVASTEVKASSFDASKFPPGTPVSVVYDHSTKTIAMLNKNNYVVEYF